MITRGKLASATGCHVETVRYYERVGLLSVGLPGTSIMKGHAH